MQPVLEKAPPPACHLFWTAPVCARSHHLHSPTPAGAAVSSLSLGDNMDRCLDKLVGEQVGTQAATMQQKWSHASMQLAG